MSNLKSLKALKKLMQEEGLVQQLKKGIDDPKQIFSGSARDALEDYESGIRTDWVLKNLRNERKKLNKGDFLLRESVPVPVPNSTMEHLTLKPTLNELVNKQAEDPYLKSDFKEILMNRYDDKKRFERVKKLLKPNEFAPGQIESAIKRVKEEEILKKLEERFPSNPYEDPEFFDDGDF